MPILKEGSSLSNLGSQDEKKQKYISELEGRLGGKDKLRIYVEEPMY